MGLRLRFLVAAFLTCGRLADFEADFAADARFGLDFFADVVFVELRFADRFTAGPFADFRARDFEPPRALFLVPPDFLPDFLARVAMILLLGVGVKVSIEHSDFRTWR